MRGLLDLVVCGQILRLAGPLILSVTGGLIMQLIDGLFLARYSPEAIAAVGPAGMLAYTLGSLFAGVTGYTTTLVAQYIGAGQPRRIGPAVWQGIRFGFWAGLLLLAAAPAGRYLFRWAGHTPLVCAYEARYFAILCLGAPAGLVGIALSGFFTGRGENRTVMYVQITGLLINAVLAYGLIFGRLGLPEWGIAGAATATVTAQSIVTLCFMALFLRSPHRAAFDTWMGRRANRDMMWRLVRFGLPNGFRITAEMLAWTVFLFFVGRLGTTELAATSIAWRINGIAFFPVIGLSEAIRTLVGQSQGRRTPETSAHITRQGVLVSEVWMVATAAVFLLFPRELYHVFQGSASDPAAPFAVIADQGVILLRFVAAYCLVDTLNIVTVGSLLAAGDARWTFWASLAAHALFIASLLAADLLRLGLYAEWAVATAFVMGVGLMWLLRFRGGAWKHIQVIEHSAL